MDKYHVFGLLGEGAFGRVYKTKRIVDGELVALKVISKVMIYRILHITNLLS